MNDKYLHVDFTKENGVALTAKDTMAVATAANCQQDIFYVRGKYFELAQGAPLGGAVGANTELVTTGLAPGTGWLLPGDNTATDGVEITNGIVAGSALSFTVGTDPAFYLRVLLHIITRANHTHVLAGFRNLAAYETANTTAEALTAYDNKAWIGIHTTAGVLATQTSLATVNTSTALAHAAIADGTLVALEVNVSAAGVTTYKIGHTALAGGATYAQGQAAMALAIADLAADANAVAFTFANATVLVPSIVYGMAGGAAISDTRILSYTCGLV